MSIEANISCLCPLARRPQGHEIGLLKGRQGRPTVVQKRRPAGVRPQFALEQVGDGMGNIIGGSCKIKQCIDIYKFLCSTEIPDYLQIIVLQIILQLPHRYKYTSGPTPETRRCLYAGRYQYRPRSSVVPHSAVSRARTSPSPTPPCFARCIPRPAPTDRDSSDGHGWPPTRWQESPGSPGTSMVRSR